jgi:hypothetical protein
MLRSSARCKPRCGPPFFLEPESAMSRREKLFTPAATAAE